jgi:hypothetical protein
MKGAKGDPGCPGAEGMTAPAIPGVQIASSALEQIPEECLDFLALDGYNISISPSHMGTDDIASNLHLLCSLCILLLVFKCRVAIHDSIDSIPWGNPGCLPVLSSGHYVSSKTHQEQGPSNLSLPVPG